MKQFLYLRQHYLMKIYKFLYYNPIFCPTFNLGQLPEQNSRAKTGNVTFFKNGQDGHGHCPWPVIFTGNLPVPVPVHHPCFSINKHFYSYKKQKLIFNYFIKIKLFFIF